MLTRISVMLLAPLLFAISLTLKSEDTRSKLGPIFPKLAEWKNSSQWKKTYRFIDQQKFQKALHLVEKKVKQFKEEEDDKNWTIALITKQNLLNSLHNVERSVNEFKSASWPKSLSSQVLLNLYYAQTLRNYYQYYSFEINQREKVISKSEINLKKWTRGDIFQEIQKTLFTIWEKRDLLGNTKSHFFKAYIHEGSYPRSVRGTVRDSFTYFYTSFLQDTSFWAAKHSNEKNSLNLKSLLKINANFANKDNLLNPKISPIKKISSLLADLEKWHWKNDRLSALMEARFQKVRFLKSHFDQDSQKEIFHQNISSFLRDYEDNFWWAEGMFLLASLKNEMKHDLAKVEARGLALKGQAAHPDSLGGQRCAALIKQIEHPSLEMNIMSFDSKNKRSIEVIHKNWKKIFFRAYRFNPQEFMLKQKDYSIYPGPKHIKKMLKETKPAFEWSKDLVVIGDYKKHKTFVSPKINKKGAYIVIASAEKSFSEEKNKIVYDIYQQTDLFLLKDFDSKSFHFRITDAKNNLPIKKATLQTYALDWKDGHRLLKTYSSNKEGLIYIKKENKKQIRSLVSIKYKDDVLFDPQQIYFNRKSNLPPKSLKQALIFTDRSVFRPNQKINFKVITYQNRNAQHLLPKAMANSKVTVFLKDSNGQVIHKLHLKTNLFATASGQFEIPKGHALGPWSIETKEYRARKTIKVEEYKRPTFLTELKESKNQLRLGTKAVFSGNAQYYFGLPVIKAKVKYTIKKRTSYPYWYFWRHPYINTKTQIIKTGETQSDELGNYTIEFTPKSPRGEGSEDIVYHYSISVEVLNEGGETAKSAKNFTIGIMAIKASIYAKSHFNEKNIHIKIKRTDLNGQLFGGPGTYQLYQLKQPKETLPSSEQDLYYGKMKPKKTKFQTKGDHLRARWSGTFQEGVILKTWKNGTLIKAGQVKDDKGNGEVYFKNLKGGAYRFIYSTKDKSGLLLQKNFEFPILKKKSKLKLPILLIANKSTAFVGDQLKFFVHSGHTHQHLRFEIFHFHKKIYTQKLISNQKNFINLKVRKKHLGGLHARLYGVNDHIFLQKSLFIHIPYITKDISINMERIRKKIYPGAKETWTVKLNGTTSKGKKVALKNQAELAAYMYDKSLDVFSPHGIPYLNKPSGYINRYFTHPRYRGHSKTFYSNWFSYSSIPSLNMDTIETLAAYSTGGMGVREQEGISSFSKGHLLRKVKSKKKLEDRKVPSKQKRDEAPLMARKDHIRSNFSETAFWYPHLLSNKKGEAKFSFTVPDSLTSWKVWAHAITKDLKFGSHSIDVKSVKDLMVRTYFPRFMRQGDTIDLKVVINNAGETDFKGQFFFEIKDEKERDLSFDFQVESQFREGIAFELKAGKSIHYSIKVSTPNYTFGTIKLKAFAKTKNFTDGELKELSILPSRVHLSQSKLITLKNKEEREIQFKDMLTEDKTLIHNSLIVKLDGQLFYSLLSSLPYIKNYPYRSTEQFLNTYVTTSILNSTFKKFPSIAKVAKEFSKRKTQYQPWNQSDPNHKMSLIETPWLQISKGGSQDNLLNMLQTKSVENVQKEYLRKLSYSQTAIGGFPWFKGGPPSLYMTIYLLNGLAKTSEFGEKIPSSMAKKAWNYVGNETREMINRCIKEKTCYEILTFINYTLSSYKDHSLYEASISKDLRKKMMEFSFSHWKDHSPQLKGMLSLLLNRMNRKKDAILVLESVMDSAKTKKDLGTFWAPEERSWLWYNDTIETHAYALRALMEIMPEDTKRHGLVQWLYLNKKLNHWKSTRATSEVIYSVLHYLKKENLLATQERVDFKIGEIEKSFTFSPDKYTGKDNFIIIEGHEIKPKKMNTIKISQKTKGMSFVSATWHYSTEKIPLEAKGDLFKVTRTYYKRIKKNKKVQLLPIKEGASIQVGDQLEVHLSIHSKHASEYVHLRDPRPSGFEPEGKTSRYKWDLGLTRYEEIKDSGMNFFFENLPVGEYTLKHRIRANLSGIFKTGPATLQSLYAPEFNAFSSGKVIKVFSASKDP